MSAFSDMLADLFSDEDMAAGALYYRPNSAVGVPVRVILVAERREIGLGSGSARLPVNMAELRQIEVAEPALDGRLEVTDGDLAGRRYKIVDLPTLDPDGVWTLPLREVPTP